MNILASLLGLGARDTFDTLDTALDAISAVSQSMTNGNSVHGTFDAPPLPFFLDDSPMPNGFPWGNRTDRGNNAYKDYPNTGMIRSYDFTITREIKAPDGYERDVLLVNGAFPGPTIEANWGDKIVVTVHNQITNPEEGTALHWHGFLQTETPWQDGVPGITQCPIAPGKSHTYEFIASLYGSSWYHAHYSAQYADGIQGPIIIHGPSEHEDVIDVGPVMLSDWYHDDYLTIAKRMLAPGGDPRVRSDNTLINGKMFFDCGTKVPGDNARCTPNAGISVFRFQTGKTHRLRLVNTGASGQHRFSIDNHVMTVIANDFIPIVPYDTKALVLAVGQRADVLVKADAGKAKSAFWIRSTQTECSLSRNPNAFAALYYDGADTTKLPRTMPWDVPNKAACSGELAQFVEPLYPIELPRESVTKIMDFNTYVNATNVTLWQFDGQDFRVNYNSPPLLLANQGDFTFPREWNVRNFGTNTSVRIVLYNNSPAPHPMHIHGYNFYLLKEGDGRWDGKILRPNNPTRRDVATVRPFGHLVLQFDNNNPGVWPFHCHTAWHAGGGFFASLIALPERVMQYSIPNSVLQTCRDWGTWTNTHVPDQIDSGQ